MFCQITGIGCAFLLMFGVATADTHPDSYLDEVLKQNEEHVPKNVQRRTPVNIRASLLPRPRGFKDARNWTTESVMHLLDLIMDSKSAASIKGALTQLLSHSTTTEQPNMEDFVAPPSEPPENVIIHVDDHLEAQLPSSQISLAMVINLLVPQQVADWLKEITSSKSFENMITEGTSEQQTDDGGHGGSVAQSGRGGNWGGGHWVGRDSGGSWYGRGRDGGDWSNRGRSRGNIYRDGNPRYPGYRKDSDGGPIGVPSNLNQSDVSNDDGVSESSDGCRNHSIHIIDDKIPLLNTNSTMVQVISEPKDNGP